MFKEDFKYYKSKKLPPNFNNVLDLNKQIDLKQVKKVKVVNKKDYFGLKSTKEWKAFELISHPGLIFIKNPFTSLGQLYFTIRCLQDYTKKPNKSNIDAHEFLQKNEDWWNKSKTDVNLSSKMRWVTFGYHHNWDTKVYDEDNKSPFPKDLQGLGQYIASVLGFEHFQPEAAIVNYYHADSTLSAHTDHSEQNLDAPLLSISFGQSAIFLLGGKTVDEKPIAMFIHSGDVVVMSKESRLCYHGVPKIVIKTSNSDSWQNVEFDIEKVSNEEFDSMVVKNLSDQIYRKDFECYIKKCRININIRQVLHRGQKRLCNS